MLYIPKMKEVPVEPLGAIRKNWNDTEKISMAPAQGWHAQIENVSLFFFFEKKSENEKKKLPPPGIEPGTFRSSVWRSPNWAIAALDM